MKIRLIASDMDGTLLDPASRITEENARAIQDLKRHGIEFVICSGRDYAGAQPLVSSAGIRCSYICLSGAAVYDIDGNLLSSIPLSGHNLDVIDEIMTARAVPMDIMTSKGVFSTYSRDRKYLDICRFYDDGSFAAGHISESLKQTALRHLSRFCLVSKIQDVPEDAVIFKICSNSLTQELAASLKKQFSLYPDIAAASTLGTDIELTNFRAQKGFALKAYARLRGIDPSQIMVLGDSDNDRSMFTPEFGWTVAMENAMPCILNAAKYRTRSNRENGVAWAINHYVIPAL